jgi:tetratricopeptide (TPR) repeat protein
MSEASKFQHIVNGIREDIAFIEKLYWNLDRHLSFNQGLRDELSYRKTVFEIIEWVNDVFLDKIYEVNSKVHKFLVDISLEEKYRRVSTKEIEKYLRDIIQEKEGLGQGDTYSNLKKLEIAISNYRYSIDITIDYARQFLYETNWTNMNKISLEDYIFLKQRRKYITAREELEKARQAVKDRIYEDVLNHLRPAIELAIKERFDFTRFKNFWDFLVFADSNNFPLPSYDMLYFYFGESSGRLHAGRLHTPLECQTALGFVSNFIDELELVNISQEEIDNFKKNCKWVE